MIRTFFRHLLESIKSLKRNGWMTIASLSAVFLGVILNATKLAEDIRKNVDVSVFVDIGTEQKDMDTLEQSLKELPNVSDVRFSSRDDELKKIQDAMGDSWNLFEGDSNPLYNVYVVSATDPEYTKKIAKQAGELPNVFKADYGGDSSDKIFALSAAVRTWGLGAAILLIFVAMFLISNTIRITILSRQREIQIMRLVGAKNGYIRWPFFLEGGWIGLLGSIVPIAIMYFGYHQVYLLVNPALLRSNYSLIAPNQFLLQVCGVMALIGIVIGSLGSIISMRRFLKA